MNQRLSILLLLLCVLAATANHFIIDWSKSDSKKALKSFERIVVSQYSDLINWKNGESHESIFRKRTVCQGRLEDWSDNRPFVSKYLNDTIEVVSNEQGIFLIQQISENQCSYVSCLQLLENYSISNQYLEEKQSELLHKNIRAISTVSGDFSYRGIVYFDVDGMASNIIDVIVVLAHLQIGPGYGPIRRPPRRSVAAVGAASRTVREILI